MEGKWNDMMSRQGIVTFTAHAGSHMRRIKCTLDATAGNKQPSSENLVPVGSKKQNDEAVETEKKYDTGRIRAGTRSWWKSKVRDGFLKE